MKTDKIKDQIGNTLNDLIRTLGILTGHKKMNADALKGYSLILEHEIDCLQDSIECYLDSLASINEDK